MLQHINLLSKWTGHFIDNDKFHTFRRIIRLFGDIEGYFFSYLAGHKLRVIADKVCGAEKIVNLAYEFKFMHPFQSVLPRHPMRIIPFQIIDELKGLAKIVEFSNPRAVLEIGTCCGGTLFVLTRLSAPDAIIISVDLKDRSGYPPWKIPLYKMFAKERQKIYLIRGNSHTHTVLNRIKRILDQRKLEVLFIDGDHTYEGVKRDYEMYSKLMKPGGIIAFHDILLPGPPEGVSRFWNEIKQNFKHLEIVKDKEQRQQGIGIIYTQSK